MKQEDLNKYRCKVPECSKLFKGTDFWRKHVEKRHPEWYDRVRSDVELVNTYVLDPAHIAPSRSDANSNGHFPLGNNVPTGTPRGFQLNQHGMNPMGFGMGMGAGMGVGVPPNAMPAMFAAGAGQMGMPGWGGPPTTQIPGMQGGVGPMRNHGRNMNGYPGQRMPGPYARNDGRGRMGSMGAGRGGMPMPMGMGMGMGMGMPWASGGSAEQQGLMGPQEAVQGRSLRSYEDLDAADGGKSAAPELDY